MLRAKHWQYNLRHLVLKEGIVMVRILVHMNISVGDSFTSITYRLFLQVQPPVRKESTVGEPAGKVSLGGEALCSGEPPP